MPKLGSLAPRRQALANLLVEGDQADRVLLVDHQVAERRGQADRVLELGQFLAIGVAHRSRQVHHQVAGQVGLGLELLDVEAIGLGVDVPVDVRDVVARGVLAVLRELDREALERAGVQTRDEPLDDELGAEVEPGHLADDLGLQVLFGGSGHQRAPAAGSRHARRVRPVGLPRSEPSPQLCELMDHLLANRRKIIDASQSTVQKRSGFLEVIGFPPGRHSSIIVTPTERSFCASRSLAISS